MSLGILTSSLRTLKNLNIKDVDLKNIQYDRVLGMVSSRLVDQDGDFSHITKPKTRWQLVLLSCAVCGIEFCYAAETAFVSPILLKIGVPVIYMTLIWCLSPTLGFLMVPMLGSISDRCRSKLGRRRPFILLLSIGIILGLLLVPNGRNIGIALGDTFEDHFTEALNKQYPSNTTTLGTALFNNGTTPGSDVTRDADMTDEPMSSEYSHRWSILFTVVGVVLLDFSCDACQSPCRAYLLDVSIPEDHSSGLTTFTVMAGLGGSLGYVMGGINWEQTKFGESLGGHVKVVFTMVLIIYLVCLALTITSVKECPLDKLGVAKEDLQKTKKKSGRGSKYRKFTNEDDSEEEESGVYKQTPGYGSQNKHELVETKAALQAHPSNGYQVKGNPLDTSGVDSARSNAPSAMNTDDLPADKPYQMNGDINATSAKTGTEQIDMAEVSMEGLPLPSEVPLGTYLKSILHMPGSLWVLCLTNLFCWMSLVCYSLYFTDFVGQAVYGGNPVARRGTLAHDLYEQGVRTGSFGMSLYSISCSMYSLCIEKLVKKFGAKPVYILSQLVYTVGALLMAATRSPVTVILLSPCAGIMYATLFTMPYILVAHYHSSDTFEESKLGETRDKQIRGLGTDIAVVSSMVFLAQFILSSCMGGIVHACGSTTAVVVAAAVLSFCGSMVAFKVTYLGL